MAQRKGSQLDADAMEPKTMAIARKKYPPAMKPSVPVRLACIHGNRNHALILAVPNIIGTFWKDVLVLYVSMRYCVLVAPNVMGALLAMGVTWFKTMSVGRWVVDASNASQLFFPGLITSV